MIGEALVNDCDKLLGFENALLRSQKLTFMAFQQCHLTGYFGHDCVLYIHLRKSKIVFSFSRAHSTWHFDHDRAVTITPVHQFKNILFSHVVTYQGISTKAVLSLYSISGFRDCAFLMEQFGSLEGFQVCNSNRIDLRTPDRSLFFGDSDHFLVLGAADDFSFWVPLISSLS